MKKSFIFLAAVMPFALGGCVLGDDDPDYVDTTPSSSTTVIDDDDEPNVTVTPAPNVTVTPPSNPPVIIEKETPPPVNIDIKSQTGG